MYRLELINDLNELKKVDSLRDILNSNTNDEGMLDGY
jgi:hypothetical protein